MQVRRLGQPRDSLGPPADSEGSERGDEELVGEEVGAVEEGVAVVVAKQDLRPGEGKQLG